MTKIEWTDATWNPIVGCSVVSPGCTNCYAMRMAGTRLKTTRPYSGLTQDSKAGPVWTGEVRFLEERLTQPLKWRKPRRVFVNSMGDLFHEDVPEDWIHHIFAVMALCPQHMFQVLTKRPERMQRYMARLAQSVVPLQNRALGMGYTFEWQGDGLLRWPIPNVWLGTSVEDQTRADERIPALLDTPAAVRFVSYEPALEMVDFDHIKFPQDRTIPMSSLYGGRSTDTPWHLNWIVLGGENGPGARPMHPEIPRSVRDQCAAADVPFFFKGWGKHKPVARAPGSEIMDIMHPDPDRQWFANVGKKAAGCLLDGREHKEMPGVG
ncbi:hypothetical protein LCGC14_2710710 [marine sediment metagenome]|uniref:Phage Gp37/Gp68 family protein n=1 Tax=marine sediment metagenome TaxID=412755 RepID=A0A0F9BLZ8_9ZZZZ